MWWQTSNCSPLLIYRPWEDERLSWPGWLTYSVRLTHISGHPSATGQPQDGERTLARDWCSTAEPCGPVLYNLRSGSWFDELMVLQHFVWPFIVHSNGSIINTPPSQTPTRCFTPQPLSYYYPYWDSQAVWLVRPRSISHTGSLVEVTHPSTNMGRVAKYKTSL